MSVTKAYVDAMATGINWHSSMPKNPLIGDCYLDNKTYQGYIWTGTNWTAFSKDATHIEPKHMAPTQEQLDKHPALKEAWEEYLVIKKLIGI